MKYELLNIKKTQIDIGLPSPVRLIHSSDNHICLADKRDDERKNLLAEQRVKCFGTTSDILVSRFVQSMDYACDNNAIFLSTGDIADFISYACLDTAKTQLKRADSIFAVGNHEFSKYVGEAKEDAAYKASSYAFVQSFFSDDLTFSSRLLGGLNLITLDNVYYNFTSRQTQLLKKEIEKGYPIILAFHNPIYTSELYDLLVGEKHSKCVYCVGAPEEILKSYPADRYEQQKADRETLEFISYASKQPLIKAVLAGHVHEYCESTLHWAADIPQICADGGFKGFINDITIK